MSRAQTGIFPSANKYGLVHLYRVPDIPLCSMSIGKVAAMIPGLANDLRKTSADSNLSYVVGFGPQLWSFTWQGNQPPGFRALQANENRRKVRNAGNEFVLFFSSNHPELNENLARQCQSHLKKMVKIRERMEGEIYSNLSNSSITEEKHPPQTILISNQHPEFAQGSFLLNLSFLYNEEWKNLSQEEKSKQIEYFSREITRELVDTGFFFHHFPVHTENKPGLNLLLFSHRIEFFQRLLDVLAAPSANHLINDWRKWFREVKHSVFFVPSIDLLTGLRMGGLRMGSLSPTALWKE